VLQWLAARDAARIAAAGNRVRRGEVVDTAFMQKLQSAFARRVAARVVGQKLRGRSAEARVARELFAWSEPRTGPR